MSESEDALSRKYSELWKQNKFEECKQITDKLLQIDGENSHVFHLRGNCLTQLGLYDKAIESQQMAIKLKKKAEYYSSLSVCLERSGDLNGARKAILSSSVLAPYSTGYLKQLIRICTRTGDTELGLISILSYWNLYRDLDLCKIHLKILQNKGRNELDDLISLPDISEIKPKDMDFLFNKASNFDENHKIREKISRSFLGRNEDYERGARKFLDILQQGNDNPKTIIHSTERYAADGKTKLGVGGLADRVKGAATCMILAASIGARFQLDWKTPIPLEDFFAVPERFIYESEESKTTTHNWIDRSFSEEVRKTLSTKEISEILPDGLNLINCNSMNLEILKNPTNNRLKEFSNLGRIFWVGTIFRILEYKPGLREMGALISMVHLKEYFTSTLGVQFRLGGDRAGWKDPVLDDLENLDPLISAAIDGKEGKKLVLFASDSEEARDKAMQINLEDCEILSPQIPIYHVDRSSSDHSKAGFASVLLENYGLSICDQVWIRKGAFGQMAANRCFREAFSFQN